MLNFDRSTVKHAPQNTQNDCHQWLSDSSRVHQIRFLPLTHLWELTALPGPEPVAGLRGPNSKGRGGKGRKESDRGRKQTGGDERKGRGEK